MKQNFVKLSWMLKTNHIKTALYLMLFAIVASCANSESNNVAKQQNTEETMRIVSLNGTITEILYAFELGDKVVANDVTSTFPEAAEQLPKVGHSRSFNAEGILMYNPSLVIGKTEEVNDALKQQLEAAGVSLFLVNQRYSLEGTEAIIDTLANKLQKQALAKQLKDAIKTKLTSVSKSDKKPKVLFIYARGAGTLLVAGKNTQMHALIELAGGENTFENIEGFKPLTAEALVAQNPDAIILFEKSVESLNGKEALVNIPGITETKAFKNNNFIIMDGQLASGFGPRLGIAVDNLSYALSNLN